MALHKGLGLGRERTHVAGTYADVAEPNLEVPRKPRHARPGRLRTSNLGCAR